MRKAGGVVALLGALLVATSSFAGWEEATGSLGASTSPSRTGSFAQNFSFRPSTTVTMESIDAFGPYLPLILVVVALLGYVAYVSLRGGTLPSRAWQAAAAAAAASLVLGAVFVVAMLAFDPSDWWLDTGFFAGLAGGAIAAFLLRRDERAATSAPQL
jgi:peptidoglycan/LPS O-acetylase OafA/YrhL